MFAICNLSVLAYAQGFTYWHYRTNDTAADVAAPGYFNEAAAMIRPSDVILCGIAGGCIQLWVADTHPDVGVLTEVMCATRPAVATIGETF